MKIKGRYKSSDGYVRLYLGDGRVIGEHRFLAEQELGRRLNYNEVIHHKDGNKSNNDPNNRKLMTRSDHTRSHQKRGRTMVKLICASCGKLFEREVRHVAYKLNSGIQQNFHCSRSCRSRRNREQMTV